MEGEKWLRTMEMKKTLETYFNVSHYMLEY